MNEYEKEAVRAIRDYAESRRNMWLQAPNGAKLSLATGTSLYCTPRDKSGPYTHVEVGFPTGIIPDSWKEYAEVPWDSETGEPMNWREADIYAWLPVELLADWFTANSASPKND